jgi:tRNA dimethylallyltransferase
VALYQKMAQEKIREIQGRGNVPIFVGGTGFYINSVVYNTDFSPQKEDDTPLRNHYLHMATLKGASYIHDLLAARDPQAAREIHPSNIKRVARALAFVESTGALFSSHNAAQKEKKLQPLSSDVHFFILDMPREKLYERINRRTKIMLNAGLEEEVAGLLKKGYSHDLPAMQAIGYKEILAETPKEILAQTIAQNTRHYAKRQLTWFRNSTPHTRWINADDSAENIAEIMQRKI